MMWFLRLVGLLAALAAAPALAADPPVSWKMTSMFPGRLAQLGTLGRGLTQKIALVSGDTVKLRFFEPGALAPPLETFDSVATGAIESAWSAGGFWYGKEKALTLFSSVPFGPEAGEYLAWMYHGGGVALMDEIYAKHGLKSLVCGFIAPEASGWFRKEIRTVEDFKGLKMRFYGLGARVMQKMGVATQLLAPGDIYPALERGTIDATEFSMPAIDLDLGFHQVAKHYYFPGWHQQATLLELLVNKKKWDGITRTQRAVIEVACGDNVRVGLAEGEAIQTRALDELRRKGVQIHRWSPEILAALEKAWGEVVQEESAADPTFAKVWQSYATFREGYKTWRGLGYLR